ncbi:MAG: thioredoxin family protein [Verrucomicrobiae bacterium]|nr:thioredoxin family protein [Verrucomicrobiae bacterium]
MPTTTQPALNAEFLQSKFSAALPFGQYVATGSDTQQQAWNDIYEQASLTKDQRALVESFTREMKILVSSGVWCGDCVQQLPLLQRIAEANPRIDLRFLDRDQHEDLAVHIQVNAGSRVPVVIYLAEDFELVSTFADRTLARYRAIAQRQLGAACAIPGAPIDDDELAATLQDWLNETERNQLILRLSPRLRQKHND